MTLRDAVPDLVLEGVSKAYGNVEAVDRISLEVRRGQFYSLLGPSGCGKTTTLRLVAGFERADSGRILLAGEDITRTPPNRRRVNTVFQNYALFPHLSVEDNVSYGLRQTKLGREETRARLNEALRTVRLENLRARHPRELSGGQQQRVALARALINKPAVLLLDEPLAALDLKLRKAMQRELKKLQERVGVAFLYVTHDQEEALTLSDRIAVMNDGRLLQEGGPRSFQLSVFTAGANCIVATALGTSAAIGLRNVGRKTRTTFDAFMYMALIVPEIVIAIASLLFFVTINFPLGPIAIVTTHAVFNTALVTLIVRARLAGTDRSLEEASADLGATRWGTFRQVTLPQLFPAVVAGALLAFTFSFDDVILSSFVSGPGSTTLPVEIFSQLRFGLTPKINVVAVATLSVTVTAIIVAQVLLRREARKVYRGVS